MRKLGAQSRESKAYNLCYDCQVAIILQPGFLFAGCRKKWGVNYEKLLSVLLCAIMVFGAIPFAASAAVSATDLTITTKPLATGKYGQVTSAQSIIEIPENASGDVEIPLDFLNEFEENVTMPGDTYTYYLQLSTIPSTPMNTLASPLWYRF